MLNGHKDMKTGSRPPRRTTAKRAGRRVPPAHKPPATDAIRQLHELQIHQLELEMQNTELRKTREELHASLTRYSALYEFAPVGYLTLGLDGSILDLNQSAGRLLGHDTPQGRHARFGAFLAPASRQTFYTFLTSTLHAQAVQRCEIDVQRRDGGTFRGQVSVVHQPGSENYLMAITDVSANHDALKRARDTEQLAQDLLGQNRSLTRRMFEVLENDRRRIAREIHEEIGGRLSAMYANLATLIRSEFKLRSEARAGVRAITANLAEMQNDLHRILLRERPTLLDAAGLEECLREAVAHWKQEHPDVECAMSFEGKAEGIPDVVNIAMLRIVQESLSNVARHARAHKLAVRVVRDSSQVSLSVEDDGDGIDTSLPTEGMGLLGMRERVIALDGHFEFHSEPGAGARVAASIPLASPALDDTEDAMGAGPRH